MAGLFGGAAGLWSCASKGNGAGRGNASPVPAAGGGEWIFEDFERPDPPIAWVAADLPSATQAVAGPAGKGTAGPHRTAQKPKTGLWALGESVAGPGTLSYRPKKPLDLSHFDQLLFPVCHADGPDRNGEFAAAATVIDTAGNRFTGDAFAVLSAWEPLLLNLTEAKEAGVDVGHVAQIQIGLQRAQDPREDGPLDFLTDSWGAAGGVKNYIGAREGKLRTFYVQSGAGHIRAGTVGQYELVFSDHGAAAQLPADAAGNAATASAPGTMPGGEAPMGALRLGDAAGPAPRSLTIFTALKPPEESTGLASVSLQRVLGQPESGLMLLDQKGMDLLGGARRKDAGDETDPLDHPETGAPGATPLATLPTEWPADAVPGGAVLVRSHWNIAWSSAVAAMVEGHEEYGPYDRLGEPAAELDWRFMIYQWGQAFVHVKWNKPGENGAAVADPISWALSSDPSSWAGQENSGGGSDAAGSRDAEERLLADVYTAPFRAGLATALPHRMQTGDPVALISGSDAQKDTFWWANTRGRSDPQGPRRVFGAGFSTPAGAASGEASCMLLVNNPNALTKAGTFSGYLSPPKVVMRQGELDVTVPGDMNNDGFVEAYGFQAIRLAGGRAAMTIYPQNRPIFYPVFLFTVPAIDRKSLDVAHSRLLVNVDGRQFADPPVFPDGSFLLQIPYVLDRPVTVEAELVK